MPLLKIGYCYHAALEKLVQDKRDRVVVCGFSQIAVQDSGAQRDLSHG